MPITPPPICLLTRPEAQSHDFAARLQDAGIGCVIAPLIRIAALPHDSARAQSAPVLALSSVHAVGFAGPGAGRHAFCVGPATARAARNAGFAVTQGPGDGAGLAALMRKAGTDGAQALHLHGRHRATALPGAAMAVYDQIAQPLSAQAQTAITGQNPIVVPLFSARSAKLSADALHKATAPIYTVAISPRADAAFDRTALQREIAPRPDASAMVTTIITLIFGNNDESGGLSH